MKVNVGDLVRRTVDAGQDGKVGIVTEFDEPELGEELRWFPVWVKWHGNADWDMEYEGDLDVIAKAIPPSGNEVG
jgi:hypothetical protein